MNRIVADMAALPGAAPVGALAGLRVVDFGQMVSAPYSAKLFSDYGASDPAEFFAVASEVFFEQPQRLAAAHGALYRELSGLYRVNPLSW